MWESNLIKNFLTYVSRYRKIALIVIVVLSLFLYLWPYWLKSYSRKYVDPILLCEERSLHPYLRALSSHDALVEHEPSVAEDKTFLPYVGNGYFGLSVLHDSRVYIQNDRTLSEGLGISPIISAQAKGYISRAVVVLDLLNGIVERTQCFQLGSVCVGITTKIYAHRTKPSLLIQDIRISNPTAEPVTLDIELTGFGDGFTIRKKKEDMALGRTIVKDKKIGVAIMNIPESLTIKSGGALSFHHITSIVVVAKDTPDKMVLEKAEKDLVDAQKTKDLEMQHKSVWRHLWTHGFSISDSKASGALNGDRINLTLYYVLSNTPALLHEPIDKAEVTKLRTYLAYPDRCYEGHHTLQNDVLWKTVESDNDVQSLASTWLLTLDKLGCSQMMKAGADGIMQAMVLSCGALKFKNFHLELSMQHSDLDRVMHWRRVHYGNNTHVNITVLVRDDNRPQIIVSLDRNDKPYYACSAGCTDLYSLSETPQILPVKITKPLTALLYITSDKKHMQELRKTIHFKEIKDAPAHSQGILAVHKHGTHYGGLPALFWISIASLIAIFHLFLLKIVLNEYCMTDNLAKEQRYPRPRYTV
ncbi:DgyrCDS3610 [Dimorphilus gyrociliatus]|uniref:DgyrCDS3610 n=1 Tax=Dimorphilus gyrociliatus TaxID=2664684 RepID=A0A7I8VDP1_9ANNE|nr:DgyrCDS3610 [Dimorphilus gyrociliatus]